LPLGYLQLAELAAGPAAAAVAGWIAYLRLYVPVPPNKALILYGRRSERPSHTAGRGSDRPRAPRVLIGGGAVLAPWNRAFAYLPLAPIEVETTVRAVHSVRGGSAAGWEVGLSVQAKIPSEPEALRAAAENLVAFTPEELKGYVRRTVDASVPVVLARLGVGEAEPDWEQLGTEIQATVGPELVPSGLIVRSVAVRELHRIVPASGPPSALEPRTVPLAAGGEAAGARTDAELRLDRIERGLRTMGLRIERWLRERGAGDDAGTMLDPAATPGWAAGETGTGRPSYDSMEEGRSPRPRRPATSGRGTGGEGSPPLSEEEDRR
jgi:hypothetical protein